MPSTDSSTAASASTMTVPARAAARGDQRAASVWPMVSVESAPQYRFMAFVGSMARVNTTSATGARPPVSCTSPLTTSSPAMQTPISAPRIIGNADPSAQPQKVARNALRAPVATGRYRE